MTALTTAAIQQKCLINSRLELGPGSWQETSKGGSVTINAETGQYCREHFDSRVVFAINAAHHQLQMHSCLSEADHVFSATLVDSQAAKPTDSEYYSPLPHSIRMGPLMTKAEALFGCSDFAKASLKLPDAHSCAVRLIKTIKEIAPSKEWSPSIGAIIPSGYSYGSTIRVNSDWLPRDPLAAAPEKPSTTGVGFKHRMAVEPGQDAGYSRLGIFDAPATSCCGPPGEAWEEVSTRIQADYEEAQRRFATILTILTNRDKLDFQRCRNACIGRARKSALLHRLCFHLQTLVAAEIEERRDASPLMSVFTTSQDFIDTVLPYIDPFSGLRMMETSKSLYSICKDNNRGFLLEMASFETKSAAELREERKLKTRRDNPESVESAAREEEFELERTRIFPAHAPINETPDKPQVNQGKVLRLTPRICFRFTTSWTSNHLRDDPEDLAMKTHVFDQVPKEFDLLRTSVAVDLVHDNDKRTLVEDDKNRPNIELGSGAQSAFGNNWPGRRLPKLRLIINRKSNSFRPKTAFRIRMTLHSSKIVNHRSQPVMPLVCFSDPFYVIGKARSVEWKTKKAEAEKAKRRAHTAEVLNGLREVEASEAPEASV